MDLRSNPTTARNAPMTARNAPTTTRKAPTSIGKKKRKRTESFSTYIYRVLKQIHPNTGISLKAMKVVNAFVNDAFELIAAEAARMACKNNSFTINSREIQAAVRLLLPGELANHAVSGGIEAVTKYNAGK